LTLIHFSTYRALEKLKVGLSRMLDQSTKAEKIKLSLHIHIFRWTGSKLLFECPRKVSLIAKAKSVADF
jgi:hypothetical protein